MAKKTEKIGTTKAADRLSTHWLTFSQRVKSLGLPTMKIESLSDKDFAALGGEMTKSKKAADWIWEFDFDSFSFEFNLLVGSKRLLLASARMNVIALSDRREILDKLRAQTGLASQGDIDKYFKVASERLAKSSEVKKIDADLDKEATNIADLRKFVAGLAKSIEGLDRGQREMDLMPIAEKQRLGGYVRFVFGLDAGFNPYKLMKDHFVKPMTHPLPSFPPKIAEKLVKEFGADEKGAPDFAAARKIAVGVIDAKAMPAYRREMAAAADAGIKTSTEAIRKLTAKRNALLGTP